MSEVQQQTLYKHPAPTSATSLVQVLQRWADYRADTPAFTFLGDDEHERTLTYAELDADARRIGGHLQRQLKAGDRALLLFAPGLEFIQAFMGCVYAGVLPVPTCYPKPNGRMPRLTSIARDAGGAAVLSTSETFALLSRHHDSLGCGDCAQIAVDGIADKDAQRWADPKLGRDDIAFLQYTSGSTSDPKGVMVSHGNLLQNLESIRRGFHIEVDEQGGAESRSVFWLPAYHDMGLIGGILTPLFVGGFSYLMSPRLFLQRPLRWLSAIDRERATISGAPNFAFDLCVDKITDEQRESLDLTTWKTAFCGAEPIRAETLERFAEAFDVSGFARTSFYPCYGLAESTLLVAGGDGPAQPHYRGVMREALTSNQVEFADESANGSAQRLVGCGGPAFGQEIEIVDLVSHDPCDAGKIGEIWVKGPSNAKGYWNRPEDTQRTFNAFLSGGEGPFLRTGDLGFRDGDHLYITGRLKDMIIVRGRNHYPQDIEYAVSQSHEALQPNAGAAFSVSTPGGESVVVVHEVNRNHRNSDLAAVVRTIRHVLVDDQEIDPLAIVLLRPGGLPLTTSGKVQRALCRQRSEDGQVKILHEWKTRGPPVDEEKTELGETKKASAKLIHTFGNVQRLSERIEIWLLDWLVARVGVPCEEISRDRAFAEYGLDSLTSVELRHGLEEWLGLELTPVLAWNYPTAARLSRHLAQQVAGEASHESDSPTAGGLHTVAEFERLLTQIESMSEQQIEQSLASAGPYPQAKRIDD